MNDSFKRETRAWLEANAPKTLLGTRMGKFDGYWGGRKNEESADDVLRWFEVMKEKGWTAPAWPKAWGGGGLLAEEAEVLNQLLQEYRLPPPLVGFGLTMIGPTLLDFGSATQKSSHLPRICKGEIRWCQGYSEPGAGSDLASLRTKAVSDGDDFIVSGQKIWTSHADRSDWIFCLVRTSSTGKKQEGITFLVFDLNSPGVEVRNIELISGASPFCEVFLDEVRVPKENVIGEIGDGWRVAKALLNYERSMIGEAIGGQMARVEAELLSLAAEYRGVGGEVPTSLKDTIAKFSMRERAFVLTVQKVREQWISGKKPGLESSILKVVGSELKQWRWELAEELRGLEGSGWAGEGFSEEALSDTRQWLRSRANTIEGGTTEIQLNVIAKRVLGLPLDGRR
ncbi:MAG: acyl-CoA dehydrogenase family protein [Myxococcota bacterium]|nr:acyl-CoA dehydrogenase family protein [Myxococcota bacterium]